MIEELPDDIENDVLDDIEPVGDESQLYEHFRVVVDKGQEMMRVDKYLFDRLTNASRNRIQKAADAGFVMANDKPVKSSYKVKPLDVITVMMDRPRYENEVIPEDIPLNIVYEDKFLMVVNKPAGLVVHPGHGNYHGTLVNAIAWHMKDIPDYDANDPHGLDRQDHPYKLISVEDTRFLHCNIKTLNLIPNCMAMQQAVEAGCDEVVFHRGDRVTEGAHSGLAILKDGVFCTPPADNLILPSITRKHFLTLCDKLGVPTRIAPFTVDELKNADEVMILSTGTHCVGACELDGKPLGGKDPALLDKLQKAYQQWFDEETAK